MKLIGLMCCRNESWCLRTTMAAALQYLDHLVVCDHASSDDTPDILTSFAAHYPEQVVRMHEPNPAWNEATIRQRLLDVGRHLGGTHFIVIDADEILTANLVPDIRQYASSLKPGQGGLLPWLHLWRSPTQYRVDDSPFGAKQAKCKFMFADGPFVAYSRGDYQLHARMPEHADHRIMKIDNGGVMHLQHVVWERLLWKQLWYQMIEMVNYGHVRANYAGTVNEDGIELAPAPSEWFARLPMNLLDLDEEPWQKRECLAMWRHPRVDFSGVNTFGLKLG